MNDDEVVREEEKGGNGGIVVVTLRTLCICKTRKLVFLTLNQLFIHLFLGRHRKCLRVDRSYRLRCTNMPHGTMVSTNG